MKISIFFTLPLIFIVGCDPVTPSPDLITTTASPDPRCMSSRIKVGNIVAIGPDQFVTIYSDPDLKSNLIGPALVSDILHVIGGPSCQEDNLIFWQVELRSGAIAGVIVESDALIVNPTSIASPGQNPSYNDLNKE